MPEVFYLLILMTWISYNML